MRQWTKSMVAGLILGGLTLAALPALAGTYSPGIDHREREQQWRINQGVRSGEISPGEYQRLQREQARIRWMEARMKADGRLTYRERQRLQQMLDRSNRHIYNAKHNNNRRGR